MVNTLAQLSHKSLVHAYIVESVLDNAAEECAHAICASLALERIGNPDVVTRTFPSFGIEDARWLSEVEIFKGVGTGMRIFILEVGSITTQAQNALLKLFEEPKEGVSFFLIVPSAHNLLPTLRSRCQILSFGSTEDTTSSFLNSSFKDRLEVVSSYAEDKDIRSILIFLDNLTREVYAKWSITKSKEWRSALKELQIVRSYIGEQGVSYKLLLEHIALVMPRA